MMRLPLPFPPYRAGVSRGFTLMEVLIAFAILAAALPALLHLGSTGLAGMDRAGRLTGAVDLAQSLLARGGQGAALMPGTRSGKSEDGIYEWKLSIEKADDVGFEARLVESWRVTAKVTAPRMRDVTLSVVRLRPRGAR